MGIKSPDRVYAWKVNDEPTVSAFIRVKAGKSKAGRGEYKRALPFFTMRFDSLKSALGTLMSIDDMLESVREGNLLWTVLLNLVHKSVHLCSKSVLLQNNYKKSVGHGRLLF